jgi:hypothetical protein
MIEMLSQDEHRYWKRMGELLTMAVEDLNASQPTGEASLVISKLLQRQAETVDCLITLSRHHGGSWVHQGCMMIRACFDAWLQAAYICAGSEPNQRAKDYMDFQYVEWHESLKRVDSRTGPMIEQIKASPRRATVEPMMQERFELVADRFRNKKGKLRKNWYLGDLRSIARDIGKVNEYDLLISHLHGAVHSSPTSVLGGNALFTEQTLAFTANILVLRTVQLAGRVTNTIFRDEVRAALDENRDDLFQDVRYHGN